ncbi:PIN domain-containing protein [Glycomyces xiaoerkulensis]|uniref:PIN domain-containing protein n=1 Tax=Glycomyces xiaoerkulensis TaxID=2038139 RepID=UPI0012FFF154|nr:PIN domain-containing protein [Glycomyces xiaoerkulensis]
MAVSKPNSGDFQAAPDSLSRNRGIFDDFEAYRTPSSRDYQAIFQDGIIVIDTNVLLHLYRYREETRADLLSVLRALKDRIWVPHQVVREFWRARESVLKDPQESVETMKQLESKIDEVKNAFRRWTNRVDLDRDHADRLIDDLDSGFVPIINEVSASAPDESVEEMLDTRKDPIVQALSEILDGSVGSPFDEKTRQEKITEAMKRFDMRKPPGFKDQSKKEEQGAGDYLLWAQTLIEAQQSKRDVLIVTADVKEDWWRRTHGQTRGPHPDLVEEMKEEAGVRLFMLQPKGLMIHAKATLSIQVRDESVEDIERADKRLTESETGGWTKEGIAILFERLMLEDRFPQEWAIHEAAFGNGFVSREQVYELAGYDTNRSLRGFTRPIIRLSNELRMQGYIAEDAVEVLTAVYDSPTNPGSATGFRLNGDLIELVVEVDSEESSS